MHVTVATYSLVLGRGSRVGDRLCLWETLIFDPHKFDPLDRSPKIVTDDYVGDSYTENQIW